MTSLLIPAFVWILHMPLVLFVSMVGPAVEVIFQTIVQERMYTREYDHSSLYASLLSASSKGTFQTSKEHGFSCATFYSPKA